MSNRSREYVRTKSYWKAKRKHDIDRDRDPWWYYHFGAYYNNLHQYSKNKIHCSCPLCAIKTRNKNYGPALNWSKSDQRKIDSLTSQLNDVPDDEFDEEV